MTFLFRNKGNVIIKPRKLIPLIKAVGRLTFIVLFPFPIYCQAWDAYFPLQGPGSESIRIFEPISSNRIFIGGVYDDHFSPGGENLPLNGSKELFFGEWDANGQNTWIAAAGSPDIETLDAAVVRADGTYILGGRFFDSIQFGAGSITSDLGSDAIFLACTDSEGELCWSFAIQGTAYKALGGIQETETGDLLVVGAFNGFLYFEDVPTLSSGSGTNCFVARFTANGLFVEATQFESSLDSGLEELLITDDGQMYLAGYFNDTLYIGTDKLVAETQDQDLFITKFNPESFTPVWSRHLGAQYDDQLAGISWYEDKLYIGGSFLGVLNFKTGTLDDITTPGFNNNGFLASLSSEGVPLSLAGFGGLQDENVSCFNFSSGKPLWAGYYTGDPSLVGQNLPTAAGFSFYGFAGSWKDTTWPWAVSLTTDDQAFIEQIASDELGQVWVSGFYKSNVFFDGVEETSGGFSDAFFGRLNPLFTPVSEVINPESIILYPNPTSAWLYLDSCCPLEEIRIIDQWGRNCSIQVKGQTINLEDLPDGVYYIQIKTQGALQWHRIIKH
ncbi:MAG: T9SS type A sorting domain-containing protein [Saprospiraceae bacterium]|nr:T9SS type A sorting domain-containing protein [Saprospiraceae bacterium]